MVENLLELVNLIDTYSEILHTADETFNRFLMALVPDGKRIEL